MVLEFPTAPVNGAGTQNTESERTDKQHLPGALPSLGIVTCMTLATLHLICPSPGSAINMQSKQILASKESAVIIDYICRYNLLIMLYLFIPLCISLLARTSLVFSQWFCLFHLSNSDSLSPLPPAPLL